MREEAPSLDDGLDGGHDILDIGVFQDESLDAERHHAEIVVLVAVHGQRDDLQAGPPGRQLVQIAIHPLEGGSLDGARQLAHRPDIVGMGTDQFALGDQADLGTAAAHIHVHVVSAAVEQIGDVAVVDDAGLFDAVDDLQPDARLVVDVAGDALTVRGVPHRRSGAGPVGRHVVDLH